MSQYPYPKTASERRDRLKVARSELKNKFIGIDDQIDSIVDRISFWYVTPERVHRPLIINLWGPTGVGKTDLVRDLKMFLGMEDRFLEQIFSDHEGEHSLLDSVHEDCMDLSLGLPGIMVLDEFQRYKTKENDGTSRRGLGYKDVWQILSDGVIVQTMDKGDLYSACRDFGYVPFHGFQVSRFSKRAESALERMLEDLAGEPPDPVVAKESPAFVESVMDGGMHLTDEAADKFYDSIQESSKEEEKVSLIQAKLSMEPWLREYLLENLKYRDPENVYYMCEYSRRGTENIMDLGANFRKISKFITNKGYPHDGTVEGLMEAVEKVINSSPSNRISYENDFRKNLIFVLGNLDGVYEENLPSTSPFIPADIYRDWCRRITIFDVKKELSKLFFPEQVARLGNIHIVYPTLGEAHFRELIKRNLDEQVLGTVQGEFEIKHIDSSVYDYVYRNGVYPVQGVRPVFSSIQDTCTFILTTLYQQNPQSPVTVSYSRFHKALVINCDTELNGYYPMLGDRDRVADVILGSESETYMKSVHEIGHALAVWVCTGKAPVCCFVDEDGAQTIAEEEYLNNFENMWSHLLISLAGYAANYVLQGPTACTGHARDLAELGRDLVRMVRVEGFRPRLEKKVYGPVRRALLHFRKPPYDVNIPYASAGAKDTECDEYILETSTDRKLLERAASVALKEVFELFKDPALMEALTDLSRDLSRDLFISGEDIARKAAAHKVPVRGTDSFRTKRVY